MKKILFGTLLLLGGFQTGHSSTLPYSTAISRPLDFANEQSIKAAAVDSYIRSNPTAPPPAAGSVIVRCHTSYALQNGVACVSVDTSLFQVTWAPDTQNGIHNPIYTATPATTCSCN